MRRAPTSQPKFRFVTLPSIALVVAAAAVPVVSNLRSTGAAVPAAASGGAHGSPAPAAAVSEPAVPGHAASSATGTAAPLPLAHVRSATPGGHAGPGSAHAGHRGHADHASASDTKAGGRPMPGMPGMPGMQGMPRLSGMPGMPTTSDRYSYLRYASYAGHMEHAGATPMGGHVHGGASCTRPPTAAQISWADRFAVRVAKRVQKLPVFEDKATGAAWLRAHGFVTFDLGFISDGTGLHWIDLPSSIRARGLDPDHPGTIIYLQTEQGYRPVGAMFSSNAARPPDDPGGCLTHWHNHADVGAAGLGWMLHVWTYGIHGGPWTEPDCGLQLQACVSKVRNPLHNPRVGR